MKVFSDWFTLRKNEKPAADVFLLIFVSPAPTDDLSFAMSMNPNMNILIAHGYYDIVTPYFCSERLVR